MGHHPAFGAALAWDSAGGASYTAVGQVKDIQGPNITRADVDVTDHDSPDGYREYLPGLADGGTVTFIIGFDNANVEHTTNLLANLEDDQCTMATWQLTLNVCNGTAVWTWSGYVNNYNPSAPVEGENTAALSIKVSGKPALTVS